MFKKYDITIEKKEAGIPYRRNLQIWSESIEKVLKIMGIKLHKDPKYFGYNIVDIKSAEDSFYNINYDTIETQSQMSFSLSKQAIEAKYCSITGESVFLYNTNQTYLTVQVAELE